MFESHQNQLANSASGGFLSSSLSKFGDPFLLPSWSIVPENLQALFEICRFLYIRTPEYARASQRVTAYFLTDVDFIGAHAQAGDKKEQDELREWLRDGIAFWVHLAELGMDWAAFGNAFGRMHRPFNRFLLVPTDNGHAELSVSEFPKAIYESDKLQYRIQDPTRKHRTSKQQRMISVPFIDRVSRDLSGLTLRRIDPSYAYIQHSDRSGRYRIVERFQPHFKTAIKNGDLWQVNETPIAQLRAIATDSDFLYNEGEVFHLKAPCISGISDSGWGMPEILANFPNIHQLAVYRRIDEALGLDYMLPFRVFFPNAGGGGGNLDAFASQGSMQVWQGMLRQMISDHRKDPFAIHAQPFAMGYTEVNSSGKSLTPKDSMEWQTNAMLNAQGFPAELYSGSMAWQQVPTALRLFENCWQHLPWNFNRHLKWVVRTALDFVGREQMQVRAASPRILDDIESRQVYLQLAAGGEFPRRMAFRPYGVDDPIEAAAERKREDIEIKKMNDKIEADAALEAGAGSLNGGGGAGGAPGGVSYTPSQKAEAAGAEAQRLLQIPDVGDRAKQLAAIRASDPDMHALVRQKMTEMRAAARSQGGAQVAELAAAGA